ncbi:hypothetical protein AB1L07_02475 [Niallia alba]|uniref:hypothetical protein n=1 Tax=Niallia alba TaxID=2729105 RepID=UPI00399FC7A0
MARKKSALELSDEISIGLSFPKGLSEVNYDYETYQSSIIREQDGFIEFLVDKLNMSREELENEFNRLG